MLNSFVLISLADIAGAASVRGRSSWVCLHKQFNIMTTTTNAAT
ncbi:hypothetical protein [Limnohabitans sp.]|jgi:hypothetical protein